MNVYHHLQRINRTRHKGSRLHLWFLLANYYFRYLFWRPALVRLLLARRYRRSRKLLYTVLIGDYDRLNELSERLPGWDYVCFTDNPFLKSSTWQIRVQDNELDLDPVRLSRFLKINNHLIDDGYDISVYIDANIRLRGDLDCFVAHALPRQAVFAILLHPFVHSLVQELENCIAIGKDDGRLLRRQYEYYTAEGFADPYPHVNARMMIRRSGAPAVRRLMERWFGELRRWSRRDQIAFNYALSQCPEVQVDYVPYWIFRRYFKKMDHS